MHLIVSNFDARGGYFIVAMIRSEKRDFDGALVAQNLGFAKIRKQNRPWFMVWLCVVCGVTMNTH